MILLYPTFNSVGNTLFVCSNIPPSFLTVWIFITDENSRISLLNLEVGVYNFRVCLECWDTRRVSVLVLVSSLRCKEDFLCSSPVTFPSAVSKTLRAQQGCSGLLGLHEALALVRVSAAGFATGTRGTWSSPAQKWWRGLFRLVMREGGVVGGA